MTTTMNTIISKVALMFFEKRCGCIKFGKLYLSCGFFNSASLILTNKSLQYVSYPVQGQYSDSFNILLEIEILQISV